MSANRSSPSGTYCSGDHVVIQTKDNSVMTNISDMAVGIEPQEQEVSINGARGEKAANLMHKEADKLIELAEMLLTKPLKVYQQQDKLKAQFNMAREEEVPFSIPFQDDDVQHTLVQLKLQMSRLNVLSEAYMTPPKNDRYIGDEQIDVCRAAPYTNPDLTEVTQQTIIQLR